MRVKRPRGDHGVRFCIRRAGPVPDPDDAAEIEPRKALP